MSSEEFPPRPSEGMITRTKGLLGRLLSPRRELVVPEQLHQQEELTINKLLKNINESGFSYVLRPSSGSNMTSMTVFLTYENISYEVGLLLTQSESSDTGITSRMGLSVKTRNDPDYRFSVVRERGRTVDYWERVAALPPEKQLAYLDNTLNQEEVHSLGDDLKDIDLTKRYYWKNIGSHQEGTHRLLDLTASEKVRLHHILREAAIDEESTRKEFDRLKAYNSSKMVALFWNSGQHQNLPVQLLPNPNSQVMAKEYSDKNPDTK